MRRPPSQRIQQEVFPAANDCRWTSPRPTFNVPPMRLIAHILLAVLLGGGGCRTVAYYQQAVTGQCEMLRGQSSIDALVEDNATEPALRKQLQLVQELHAFARDELGMSPGKNYTRYRDLQRPYAVWVVCAAPEFSTRLKSWWYPVVGHFSTRGFFREPAARSEAARLRAQGLDVFVGGAPAYSTLGWFNDPVLNTFIHYPEEQLAELLFHELAHHHLFLAGDTTFNESYATALAELAVARWLEKRHGPTRREAWLARCQRAHRFHSLLFTTQEKLKAVYGVPRPHEDQRAAKAAVFEELKTELRALSRTNPAFAKLAQWAERPINNATLGAIAVYNHRVPAFRKLYENSGKSFPSFYSSVRKLMAMEKTSRELQLDKLSR